MPELILSFVILILLLALFASLCEPRHKPCPKNTCNGEAFMSAAGAATRRLEAAVSDLVRASKPQPIQPPKRRKETKPDPRKRERKG